MYLCYSVINYVFNIISTENLSIRDRREIRYAETRRMPFKRRWIYDFLCTRGHYVKFE